MARQYGADSESAKAVAEEIGREREKAKAVAAKTEKMLGIAIAAIGVLFLAFGVFRGMVVIPGQVSAYEAAVSEAQAQYESVKAEFDATGGHRVVYVKPEMNSAKACGEEICRLQNELTRHNAEWKKSGSAQKSTEYLECLMKYQAWVESSVGSGNMDAWSELGTWSFGNTYDYIGENTYVVWSCYEASDTYHHRPLAFAIGYYNPKTTSIVELSVRRTAYYQDLLAGPVGTSGDDVPEDQDGDPSIGDPSHNPLFSDTDDVENLVLEVADGV